MNQAQYCALVVVIIILIVLIFYYFSKFFVQTYRYYGTIEPFQDMWADKQEKEDALSLLSIVDEISQKNNLTYFVFCGTLLGAERHKGLIPWDDDIDIVMEKNDIQKFKTILTSEYPDYKLNISVSGYKLFSKSGKKMDFSIDRWPFIDIYPMTIIGNGVSIVDDQPFRKEIIARKSDIYPLLRHKFETITVNVPNKYIVLLDMYYGEDWDTKCVSSTFSHKLNGIYSMGKTVPCSDLGINYTLTPPEQHQRFTTHMSQKDKDRGVRM